MPEIIADPDGHAPSRESSSLPDHDQLNGDHEITVGCPLACLTSMLSRSAYSPLERQLP
jgi:hypothetical protein